jgi:hypothetical protein
MTNALCRARDKAARYRYGFLKIVPRGSVGRLLRFRFQSRPIFFEKRRQKF